MIKRLLFIFAAFSFLSVSGARAIDSIEAEITEGKLQAAIEDQKDSEKRAFQFEIAERDIAAIMKLSEDLINKNLGSKEATYVFNLEQVAINLFADLRNNYKTLSAKEFQEKQKSLHAIRLELEEMNDGSYLDRG